MRIPQFTADMSLYRRGERYGSQAKPGRINNRVNGVSFSSASLNGQVVPAQLQGPEDVCVSVQGRCTPPSGGTSIATNQGFRQVCRGPSQVAWVDVCRWPNATGRITSVERGCNSCGGGGTGGGGSSNPCGSATPCAGGCCPSGLPICNILGDGTSWCCPSGLPVARRLPFFLGGGVVCSPF